MTIHTTVTTVDTETILLILRLQLAVDSALFIYLANLKVLQELDSQSFIHHYNTGTNRVVPSYSRNLLLIFLVGITSSSDESWVKCLRIC